MKTMRIEKNLRLHENVDDVLNIYVSEGLKYNREEDGIRATGPVYIKGQYMSGNESKPYQDVLEMDVLAPQEKLSNEKFELNVSDYEATPSGDQIKVQIVFEISGLIDPDAVEEPIEVKEEVISADNYEEDPEEKVVISPEYKEVYEDIEEQVEAKAEQSNSIGDTMDNLEDLFEDAGNVYTSYRIIVAKGNDTYHSISQRYEVEESDLRDTNKNKEVQAKTLVILPYATKTE